ncbi:MAG: hypothetical protein IJJ25_11375 [Lachnospiraceae bacterium]|nr:hypothetical protein [Lachnospiraceae bacterium]
MLKERYEKPVMTPAENSLTKEKYERPDMDVMALDRTTAVIITSGPMSTVTVAPTSYPSSEPTV